MIPLFLLVVFGTDESTITHRTEQWFGEILHYSPWVSPVSNCIKSKEGGRVEGWRVWVFEGFCSLTSLRFTGWRELHITMIEDDCLQSVSTFLGSIFVMSWLIADNITVCQSSGKSWSSQHVRDLLQICWTPPQRSINKAKLIINLTFIWMFSVGGLEVNINNGHMIVTCNMQWYIWKQIQEHHLVLMVFATTWSIFTGYKKVKVTFIYLLYIFAYIYYIYSDSIYQIPI